MGRQNILLTLLFVWIFAILAPPVISLINDDGNAVITINLNEEEQQEQGKKSQDEEKIVKENAVDLSFLANVKKGKTDNFYVMSLTDHTVEILLPPPERT